MAGSHFFLGSCFLLQRVAARCCDSIGEDASGGCRHGHKLVQGIKLDSARHLVVDHAP